ncbi:NADPH-dependent 7-cyano-7-deazaguanine reductase QueF [Advenella alkanexedens]|uniref:NADPH-dependent 7-cyano-7-deazaguanine reductase QueF n=1 Tax=Advenella alkanexedens TaxID=1481665 RepID=UPI002675C316|nr:NADPH-dependent 7-cyano-7-deazaguanine reductase QueF [Advenella alkanexedens]WKU19245.1 NADPH-dependent 7-cyano-7-deazaguanine reductase QueF [Advenella alkanexedens]
MINRELNQAPLGKETQYPDQYDPSLLFPIARTIGRSQLSLQPHPAWYGADIWNAYELSWLNPKGKPQVAMARFSFDAAAPNIIESKSFKLYLNSFNQTRLNTSENLLACLQTDLSVASGAPVSIQLIEPTDFSRQTIENLDGILIDELDVTPEKYEPDASLLQCDTDTIVHETLVSNLLKSNCPVTRQPDWGSLQISYEGPAINHASLLEYIISYRNHDGFHEQCVEQIFCDIMKHCQPAKLFVYARYTRRGGLDINPWRSTSPIHNLPPSRQARQ